MWICITTYIHHPHVSHLRLSIVIVVAPLVAITKDLVCYTYLIVSSVSVTQIVAFVWFSNSSAKYAHLSPNHNMFLMIWVGTG